MITLRNIKKTFSNKSFLKKETAKLKIFDGLNLKVNSGDFIIISGANGSGKTSLLRLIKGSLLPDHGSVQFDDSLSLGDVVLFSQNYRSFFLNLSVFENLNFFHQLNKQYTKKKFENKTNELLSKFDLENKKNNIVSSLSSGEIKKLILIRGYLQNGKILLFDEITNSLDAKSKNLIIKDLDDTKKTVIWVSHDSNIFKRKDIINLKFHKGKLHSDS